MDSNSEYQEMKTLWIGDVDHYMDENYVHALFAHTGELVNVKLIRDKLTGRLCGYGFVEFTNHYAAKKILDTYNGQPIPGTTRCFRLNWAAHGYGRKPESAIPEFSIFVGDLAADVTDHLLHQTFSRYQTIKSAKVVIDPQTGASRGYGFVRFGDQNEASRAIVEMQGVYCSSRPIRVRTATPKKALGQNETSPASSTFTTPAYQPNTAVNDTSDPDNTTIFIGGLDPNATEEDLRRTFQRFGELIYVKIPPGKGCGFVQFVHRSCAEAAFSMHGEYIGNQCVRLSWGRPSHKLPDVPNVVHSSSYMFGASIDYSAYGPAYANAFMGAYTNPICATHQSSMHLQLPSNSTNATMYSTPEVDHSQNSAGIFKKSFDVYAENEHYVNQHMCKFITNFPWRRKVSCIASTSNVNNSSTTNVNGSNSDDVNNSNSPSNSDDNSNISNVNNANSLDSAMNEQS